MNTYCRTSS